MISDQTCLTCCLFAALLHPFSNWEIELSRYTILANMIFFNYPVLGWFYQEQNFPTLSFSLLQVYWPWHLIYCFTWLLYSYCLGKKIWFRAKLLCDLRIITMLRANQIARIKSDIKMDTMEVSKSE